MKAELNHNGYDKRSHVRDVMVQAMEIQRQTGSQTQNESGELMPVRVILPGPRSLHLPVRPSDTLGSMVELLQDCRLLMGVRDIFLDTAVSLSSQPGWRSESLSKSGVGPGAKLFVDPVQPRTLRVAVYAPTQNAAVAEMTVDVAQPGGGWEVVLEEVQHRCGYSIDDSTQVWQWGLIHTRQGNNSRAILCADEMATAHCNEDNSEEVDEHHAPYFLLNIVTEGWGLAAAPSRIPVVDIFLNTDVCSIDDYGMLVPEDIDILSAPESLLLLHGLRLLDCRDKTAALLILMTGGGFCDVGSGAEFEGEDNATDMGPPSGGEWRRVVIILKDGDCLPHYRIPESRQVIAFTRCGAVVGVEGGKVVRLSSAPVLMRSQWITSSETTPLDHALASGMRRSILS